MKTAAEVAAIEAEQQRRCWVEIKRIRRAARLTVEARRKRLEATRRWRIRHKAARLAQAG